MMQKQSGLSLVEVMVSIAIISVIGLAVSAIINRTFSGNTKTELIGTLKYNGQTALATMEKNIRDSETVACFTPTTPPSTTIVLLQKDSGNYIRLTMSPEQGTTNGTIYSEILTFAAPPADSTSLCNLLINPLNFQSTQKVLTDNNSKTAVSLQNTSGTGFTVVKTPGFKDTVKIQFDLGPSTNAPQTIETTISNAVRFQTTVQIR